jgi:O-methyltransferase involved in polyketide biosynthesis
MASIGPTAHYTGHVWTRNGLSHPALATREGALMHAAAEAALLPVRLLGGPTMESFLLARHRAIDAHLEAAIAAGEVTHVLEIACGMSPRGWRFTERHPDLVYVEADLPDMAERKRTALARIGRPPTHRVVALDALVATGPRSLRAVARELDPAGLAVVTEGLLNYLGAGDVRRLWTRIAAVARLYLADLFVRDDAPPLLAPALSAALAAFVRSPVSVHFTAQEARDALRAAGFAEAVVEHPRGSDLIRVVRAGP